MYLFVQSTPHPIAVLLSKTNTVQSNVLHMGGGITQPCIPKATLFLHKLSGDLGIPNFSSYYYTAQLAQLPKYHTTNETPLLVAF